MCILSIIRNKNECIFTHNRDEHKDRKSSDTLRTKFTNHHEITYPEDLQSNGTWIATSKLWTTAILNGAGTYHEHNPPYRHSRGLFPFMLMEWLDVNNYHSHLNLDNIEPFTQVILNNENLELYQLTWNGAKKSLSQVKSKLFVLSSSTLYNETSKSEHIARVTQLKDKTPDNLADIHHELKWEYQKAYPYIKTTSITQILINSKQKTMRFKNNSL